MLKTCKVNDMLFDQMSGYSFYFRSGGVVVLNGDNYIGFYDTYDEAFEDVLEDKAVECLKTGLYFHVGDLVYHCDMFGNLKKQVIHLKGFAPQPTEYNGISHAAWDKAKDALVPSDEFVEFMQEWNRNFAGWESWQWLIDDKFHRFTNFTHTPKV